MDMSVTPRKARAEAAGRAVKTVNLALQGGGAHGAFAWGVLDRLIEDGRIAFEGISATSAGAMNAAVLAYGWTRGGRDGAREQLAMFWRAVSDAGAQFSPFRPLPWAEILNRLNEVSFNSSLMREMRAIAFVTSLIERGKLSDAEARRMLIHAIRADEEMVHHGVSSKLNADWSFLTHLRDKGRAHAERWLARHFDALGRASSVDIRAEFL